MEYSWLGTGKDHDIYPALQGRGQQFVFWSVRLRRAVPANHNLGAIEDPFVWKVLREGRIPLNARLGLERRPSCDPVLMLKMPFLSYLYALSERDTERFVNDSISAH